MLKVPNSRDTSLLPVQHAVHNVHMHSIDGTARNRLKQMVLNASILITDNIHRFHHGQTDPEWIIINKCTPALLGLHEEPLPKGKAQYN